MKQGLGTIFLNCARKSVRLSVCGTIVATMVNVASAADKAPAKPVTYDDVLATMGCKAAVTNTADSWGSANDWRFAGPDVDGAKAFRTPTKTVGEWIEVKFLPDNTIQASRLTPHTLTESRWAAKDCKPEVRTQARPLDEKKMDAGFSDEKLAKILKKTKQGLVYAWSPSMQLSIRGVNEVRKVAKDLKMDLVVVVDPAARKDDVAAVIKKNKWPANYNQRMVSIELVMRNMPMHYPSLLVFKKGRFVSNVFPGYEAPELLKPYLTSKLEEQQ